jgi:hypothetical protein
MTFSNASVSACEVDDVAAIAAGTDGLRGGEAAGWRVAGAKAGAAVSTAAVLLAAVAAAGAVFLAVLAAVLGTTLRAIGRGFGNGTLGLAAASTAKADNPKASARLVANAVDRNAAARADRVTAFLTANHSIAEALALFD